jgi:DNA-directed RNA polymerase specialized sigma24 family protein
VTPHRGPGDWRRERLALVPDLDKAGRQPPLDMTTYGCHNDLMAERKADIPAHQETFKRLREVREEAVRHTRLAQQLHAERRDILRGLIAEGFSQAEIARELGVTRQAIQKMLAG